MNIFEKIRELKFPFIALVAALSFSGLVAPANATGTSVTSAQVLTTAVNRANISASGSTLTYTANLSANETVSSLSTSIDVTDNGSSPIAIQAGDSVKVSVTYANVTQGTTGTAISLSYFSYNAYTGMTSSNGYSMNSVAGSAGAVSSTYALSTLLPNTYSQLYLQPNINFSDSAAVAGDQLRITIDLKLVRGGVETALSPSAVSSSANGFYFRKSGTVNHTAAAGETMISTQANFCIYRGENGVTDNTLIDVTVSNSGTGNQIGYQYLSGSVLGGMGITKTSFGGVDTFTMPASGWSVVSVFGNANVSSSNITVGQTFTPVISAVIQGTSISVLDTCSRQVQGVAAATATPGSASTTVSWVTPVNPATNTATWSSVFVRGCTVTYATCGQYVPPSSGPTSPYFNMGITAIVASGATSLVVNAQNATVSGAPWDAATDYKYFVIFRDSSSTYYAVTPVSAAVNGSGVAQQQVQQQVSSSVRPAPAFTINSRPAVSAKGQSLTLNGENLSDVTSVKVGGKEAKISKKADGEIVIDLPAGTEGYPEVELTHAGGVVTMQGLIQVIKPYALTRSLNITKFVGNRPTLAGIEAIEQAYLAGTTANILTCVATVASDASVAEIAKTETRANATCARVVKYAKYIKAADVHISKDGAAGSKSVLAITFDRTLGGK